MSPRTQSYANHRRVFPLFHFVASPLLAINLVHRVWVAARAGSPAASPAPWWDVVLAAGLVALAFSARLMALTVQNRVVRLEERLRLARVLPAELQGEIDQLTTAQLIGLRFAADAELPALVRRCRAGELRRADEVKREVREWRADQLRV